VRAEWNRRFTDIGAQATAEFVPRKARIGRFIAVAPARISAFRRLLDRTSARIGLCFFYVLRSVASYGRPGQNGGVAGIRMLQIGLFRILIVSGMIYQKLASSILLAARGREISSKSGRCTAASSLLTSGQ